MELEPRDRPRDRVMGDNGGESTGVAVGETDTGEDRNGSDLAQDPSKDCRSGDSSYDSGEFALLGLC